MAKETDDLVLRILREIQKTQAEHGRILADHTRRFESMSKRLDEVRGGMIAGLGLATNADVRHDAVQRELDELRQRLEVLEAKV